MLLSTQLFQRRAKYVRKNEQKWWKQLSADFMSKESNGGEDGAEILVRHSPAWRSQGRVTIVFLSA